MQYTMSFSVQSMSIFSTVHFRYVVHYNVFNCIYPSILMSVFSVFSGLAVDGIVADIIIYCIIWSDIH